MIQLTVIRLLSIVLTVAMAKASPNVRFYQALVFAIALGHFVVGYLYSKPQIVRAASTWRSALAAAALIFAGLYMYWAQNNVVWYFALHHALNETFILDRFTANAKAASVRVLRGAGFVFNLALYLAFVRRQVPLAHGESLVLIGIVAATVCYGGAMLYARRALAIREVVGHTAVEIAGLALLYVSFRTNISVIHIACYHFTFWALYPAAGMIDAKRYKGVLLYSALTVAITALFVAVSPIALAPWSFTPIAFTQLFAVQSFVHISLAFLLSRTNPQFIVRASEALQRPMHLSSRMQRGVGAG